MQMLIDQPDSLLACATTKVSVRLPPSLDTSRKHYSSYRAMPAGWLFSTQWHLTYSSQPVYTQLSNMQWNSSPVFPQSSTLPGQNNDLTSYQFGNSTVIATSYGIDTPRRSNDKSLGPEWDDVYDFVGNGKLAALNNTFEVLAWGYDTSGIPYHVVYETLVVATNSPTDIDVLSGSDTGPSKATLTEIFNALYTFKNAQVTQIARQVMPLTQNGARRGLGPVVCDEACVNNDNSFQ